MSALKRPGGPNFNTMAAKRIKKEIADLAKENLGDITLTADESNIFKWKAKLPGPVGSPYEGGVFHIDIEIPGDYPFSPPRLNFRTKVYHCNISSTGAICLDLLKTAWSPALSLYKVILSLSSLLTDPNPGDPLVPAIAQEYKRSRAKHDETAKEWVRLFATPIPTDIPLHVLEPLPKPRVPRPLSLPPRTIPAASSSSSAQPLSPPPQIAGTRRPHPSSHNGNGGSGNRSVIEIGDDSEEEEEESDVEILGESGRNNSSSSNGAIISNSRMRGDGARRPTKRSRATRGNGTNTSDDVIVIDE